MYCLVICIVTNVIEINNENRMGCCLFEMSTDMTDVYKKADLATVLSPIGLWTTILKPRVRNFGRLHLCFLQVTREGGVKYNQTLNKTYFGNQNFTIDLDEVKTHCERVKVETTCQSQGSPALKHPLLYGLSDS